MKTKSNKNIFKKIIFSNILLFICLFLIVFFSSNLIRDYLNKKQLNKEIDKLQQKINDLTDKNDQLTNLIGYFKSPEYLEEEARIKLNKKKPGEEVIIVPNNIKLDDTPSVLKTNDNKVINNKSNNNLKKWWQYFFGSNITND